jgi:selT/selW/selH-like putative selenoprotein
VTNLIEKYSANINIKSNINPPRSGAFEVTINNKIVFSKLKTKEFPTASDIQKWF